MEHREFKIGVTFQCSGMTYRCTDVGTRTVIAIRIDQVEKTTMENGVVRTRTLSGADAETEGWFQGPPYAVVEYVFDVLDLEGCELLITDISSQATGSFVLEK